MALTDKKYEKFYKTTGTGDDKVDSGKLNFAEEMWDVDRAIGMRDHLDNVELAPIIFQLQQVQDELDYLRTEISSNKDKTGISGSQTSAITANTAKTGITSNEQRDIADNKTNVASNANEITRAKTNITGLTNDMKAVQQNLTVTTGSGITAKFDNLKVGFKSSTIDLEITDNTGKSPVTRKATITIQ